MAAPVLFRYLRLKRRPAAARVRRINVAVGRLFGDSNITDYLNASASRDGLISPDQRSGEDLTDVVFFVGKFMRDGFEREFEAALAVQNEEKRNSLRNELIADFRKRLIRHITGEIANEGRLEAYFRVAAAYGLPAQEWLKPETERISESENLEFRNAVTKSLVATSLRVPERVECESAITHAFNLYCANAYKRWLVDLDKSVEFARSIGYHTAREEIFSQLAKGETPK